jgi:excisionase family DNA binding protein
MTKLSEYMHTAEAAEYLGVHHNTIRKWAARGDIPMHRNPLNGYRLFKRTDLDKLLKKVAKPVIASECSTAKRSVPPAAMCSVVFTNTSS